MGWSLKVFYGYCLVDYKFYWKFMKFKVVLGWILIIFWNVDIVCYLILLWFFYRLLILVYIFLKLFYDF